MTEEASLEIWGQMPQPCQWVSPTDDGETSALLEQGEWQNEPWHPLSHSSHGPSPESNSTGVPGMPALCQDLSSVLRTSLHKTKIPLMFQ